MAVAPAFVQQMKRDREEEMIHRGTEYARAIKKYYKKFGRYPANLEQLDNTNQIRFLRRRFKDPLTKDGQWKLLHYGDIQVLTGGAMMGMPGVQMGAPTPDGGARRANADARWASGTGFVVDAVHGSGSQRPGCEHRSGGSAVVAATARHRLGRSDSELCADEWQCLSVCHARSKCGGAVGFQPWFGRWSEQQPDWADRLQARRVRPAAITRSSGTPAWAGRPLGAAPSSASPARTKKQPSACSTRRKPTMSGCSSIARPWIASTYCCAGRITANPWSGRKSALRQAS